MYHNGRYAALDIGTVTCRLLIADVQDGAVHEVAKAYAITDLGAGVDASGRLSEEAISRVITTVASFMETLESYNTSDHPVKRLVAMATSASRDAENAADFTSCLAQLGVTLSVIPGEKEAALTFAGASSDFPHENLLVVDIGGGSTEIVAGRFGEEVHKAFSFNVGCRRMTDRFFKVDPPTAEEITAARKWVQTTMQGYFTELAASGFAIDRVVAVAGTATSVVSIKEALEVYDSARVHRAAISADDLKVIESRLCALTLEERKQVVGLDPKRAGVIIAGCVILEEVLKLAGATAYTASESDILKGIILLASSEESSGV
jgi:exopolyphosphatase/guanosine-5'-triphosphate,3'-diphosphate pyrophosphatase